MPYRLPRAVLLLAPSAGLGGGIERYLGTLEGAFTALGIVCRRVNLNRAGPSAHLRLLSAARTALRSCPGTTRLVVGHRALMPVAAVLAREPTVCGTSVLCYGRDTWDMRYRPRRLLERHLMRRPGVRVVAISAFTAGALTRDRPATVLRPALSQEWYTVLTEAGRTTVERDQPIRLVTAFRLADWRLKGLPELLSAISALHHPQLRLVVCGSGEPPPDLLRLLRRHPWCALRAGLSDRELAAEFAAADLFVLATRTRCGRRASGEGFGLVLLEAQAAGTPVVAPAYGGSQDAFLEGITGVAPPDDSVAALTRVLGDLLADRAALAAMGRSAARWVREAFCPEHYPDLVARRLL